ncbi:MAG TPA: hypothetical protein VFN49_12405 [Candidatus Aquilonibacter sp.]|nr:hypothetical protein [Candidatus Aquilonibacter sp.]
MSANGTAGNLGARGFLNASVLVFAASMVMNLGGFAFHAIASRHLGVSEYGALYALISVYQIAVTPVLIFTPVVARYAAEFRALHDDGHVRGLLELVVRAFAVLGLAYAIIAAVLAVPLGGFLHVASWQLLIVGAMCAVAVLSGTVRGISQGIHSYAPFSYSMAAEGIVKVAVVGLFALGGLSLGGGTAAFLAGLTAGGIVVAIPLLRQFRVVQPTPVVLDWKRIGATTAGAASLMLTVTFIGTMDVVVVKHFFSTTDAGLYSAISLCARILLYFVGFIPAILIPQATHRHAQGARTRHTLWMALIFVATVSCAGVVFYQFFGYIVLHALVGHAFDAGLGLLPTYAGAMACLAITNTLGSYALATHRLAFVVPLLVSALGTLGLIAVSHVTLTLVVHELLLGNVVMLLATAVPLTLEGLRSARA